MSPSKTIVLLIFLECISINTVYATEATTKTKEILGDRIFGGTGATIEEFPYIVSVQANISLDEYDHRCAGSIIAENVVLTSADCIYYNVGLNESFMVRYGSTQFASGGKLVGVKQMIIHEKWDKLMGSDIGLLFLNESIQFSEKAAIIELATITDVPVGENLEFAGWGFTSLEEFPMDLQKLALPMVDIQKCNETYHFYLRYNDIICAGFIDSENKGKCRGDEGGPLVWGKKQYGISSKFAIPCGISLPGFFTEVAYHKEWIYTNIERYNKLNNFVTYNQ